jgi:hypothetical protein
VGIPPFSKTEKTMLNRAERIVQDIQNPTQPPAIRDQLAEAFENYKRMAAEVEKYKTLTMDLRVENGSLVAEVTMLREALERSDADRIRLQAIASTFVGGVRSLNAVAADLYRLAIKNGIEAADSAKPEEKAELDQAGAEARDIIERVAPATVPPTVSM